MGVKMAITFSVQLIGERIFTSTAQYIYSLSPLIYHGSVHPGTFRNQKPPSVLTFSVSLLHEGAGRKVLKKNKSTQKTLNSFLLSHPSGKLLSCPWSVMPMEVLLPGDRTQAK